MTIFERIKKDRLNKEENRTILSFIMNEIMEDGKPIEDEKALEIIKELRKKSLKSIDICKAKGRLDGIPGEKEFLSYYERYLPGVASAEDIRRVIEETNTVPDVRSMGKLMGVLSKKFEIVDGKLVREILVGE